MQEAELMQEVDPGQGAETNASRFQISGKGGIWGCFDPDTAAATNRKWTEEKTVPVCELSALEVYRASISVEH